MPGNDQPQPGTAKTPRHRVIRLLEHTKQPRNDLGRDTDAFVGNFATNTDELVVFRFAPGTDENGAVFAELDRIGHVVDQTLLQARRIAKQVRVTLADVHAQGQPLFARPVTQNDCHVIDQLSDIDGLALQLDLAGLDL